MHFIRGFYLPIQVHLVGKWQHWKTMKLNGTQVQLHLPGHYLVPRYMVARVFSFSCLGGKLWLIF